MPQVDLEGYRISYETHVETPPGIDLREESEFIRDLGFVGPAYTIRPTLRIKFHVSGHIRRLPDVTPKPIEIGFVQSLLQQDSSALYQENYRLRRFSRSYPVKDGRGKPWFKTDTGIASFDDDDELEVEPLFEVEPDSVDTVAPLPFRIAVSDRPQFSFPKSYEEKEPVSAEVVQDFLTCLMARTSDRGIEASKNYFLHEYRWTCKTSWNIPTAAQTYFLTNIAPWADPKHKPPEIMLDGPSAIESDRTIFGKDLP